ncbi:MAG: efflux RND transporter periplasmic adaptor subunit [Pseudomonadota bacterium]
MKRIVAIATALLVPLFVAGNATAGDHPARLVGAADQALGVPVSGVVTEVNVTPGDRVEAGEELLRLEQSDREADLVAARARLKAERLAFEEADRERERAQTLYDRTELSEHDRQIAVNEAAAAEAAYREAAAAEQRARLDRAYSRLEAPVAGEVTAVKAHPGKAVASRDRIPTLVRLRPEGAPLAAVLRLPADHEGDLAEGSEVPVSRDGNEGEGVIGEVAATEGGWRVRLRIADPPDDWRPGEAVTVSLPD